MRKKHCFNILLAVLLAAALLLSACVNDDTQGSDSQQAGDQQTNTSSSSTGSDVSDIGSNSASGVGSNSTSDIGSNAGSNSTSGAGSNAGSNSASDAGSSVGANIGSADTPLSSATENGGFTVYFIDVGQADSALVDCDGHYMLIDGGNVADSSLLYSFLKSRDIKYLDYVIGTHGHEDHIGGIPGALSFATAGKVYCSVDTGDTKAFTNFVKAVNKQGLSITKPTPGETFALGSAQIEIMAPINFSYTDANELSIVLRITYGQTPFLFAGDAGRLEEQDILAAGYDIGSTVLKVGHHGSDTSTTYPFLRKVMPQYAVISVGKDNIYGLPTDTVLSRLRDADVTLFRTDFNSTVTCKSDGKTVSFETEKGAPLQGDAIIQN